MWSETATARTRVRVARDVLHRGSAYKDEYGRAAFEDIVADLRTAKNLLADALSDRVGWRSEAERWIDRFTYGG